MSELDDIRKRKDMAMQNKDGLDAAFDLEEISDDLLRIATEQEAELAEAVKLLTAAYLDQGMVGHITKPNALDIEAFLARQEAEHE